MKATTGTRVVGKRGREWLFLWLCYLANDIGVATSCHPRRIELLAFEGTGRGRDSFCRNACINTLPYDLAVRAVGTGGNLVVARQFYFSTWLAGLLFTIAAAWQSTRGGPLTLLFPSMVLVSKRTRRKITGAWHDYRVTLFHRKLDKKSTKYERLM